MKRNIYSAIFLFSMLLWSTGCDDFGDMNVDPNKPSRAQTSLLLTGALTSIDNVIGATTPVLYSQHLSETQYTESSRYGVVNFDFNGWYTGPLANLEEIIRINTDEATRDLATASGSNANQIAVARILKAYFFHFMTDRWGALPYFEALKGAENFSPAYNTQEEIYNDLFNELREAVAQMDNGAGVGGDILFGGNMNDWAKFANTLRMTMALRISEVDPSLAASEFADAVSGGVFDDEDVEFQFRNETNYQNPWYGRFITRTDYAVSEPLVNYMKATNDPRLPAYADPALSRLSAPGYDKFVGMPYGIEAAGDIPNSDVSFMTSDILAGQDHPLYVFTEAQVRFGLAEGMIRGWINGDAEQMYYDAIRASFETWDVLDVGEVAIDLEPYYGLNQVVEVDVIDFEDFIDQPEVAWDPANAMEQIMTQKWVALYLQGYEAWAEWRRTGFPMLTPAPDAMNTSGLIPRRHGYPTSEFNLNEANYRAAVAAQGADELDTRLWWDVN